MGGCSSCSSTASGGSPTRSRGRMLSKNGNRLRRFEPLLDTLPPGFVFDGEIVALDRDGRPRFNDLLFGRRTRSTWIPSETAPSNRPIVAHGRDGLVVGEALHQFSTSLNTAW